MKLTQAKLDKLSTTAMYGERFDDSEIRGFGAKVFPSGRKSFSFIDYGPKNERRRMSLTAP